MNHIFTVAALCSLGVLAQLVDIDFNRLQPAELHIAAVGKMDGKLPVGVAQDFTGWSPGECETSTGLDTLGDMFLRFTIRKGGAQFNIPVPDIKANIPYKVTISARNQLLDPISAYMRQLGKPYRAFGGSFKIPVSDTFGKYVFPFKTNDVPVGGNGMFIHFAQTGQFDVKRVIMEEISEDEYVQLVADRMKNVIRPAVGTANFLTYSSLPWGLQSGWVQLGSNYGCRSRIVSDASVIGPSGNAALLLDSTGDEKVGLSSEPFAASVPDGEVTVSFAYRGTGDCTAEIRTGSWSPGSSLKLSPREDEWQRASLTCRIPVKRLSAVLSIICKGGKLYVDAFRVAEKGQEAFQASWPHEIHFRLPPSDADVARIQFTDEPARLELMLTGTPQPDTVVRLSVTDLYGTTSQLEELPITAALRPFAVTYAAAARVGQYRVEAQAFCGGKAVSAVHEIVMTRLARPVFWGKDAPDSPFGIHTNQLESSLRALKAGGFNWARCHDGSRYLTCWYYLERAKGDWKFQDDTLMAYRHNNIMLYGQLGGAPVWATDLKNLPARHHTGYASVYYTPEDAFLPDYANYCETMARRYKGIIDDWFIWNEPWGALFFHKSYDPATNKYITWGETKDNATYYAKISKITFDAAKKGNPSCRITGFNAYAANSDWVRFIYDAGGYQACDEVDFHHYANTRNLGFPDDGCREKMTIAFKRIIDAEGGLTKPCIMSEGQAGSAAVTESEPHAGLLKHTLTWSSNENYKSTATAQVRYMVGYLAAGCKRIFFYTAHSYTDLSRGSDLQTMLGADGYPHPDLVAMSALACRIDGKKFIGYKKLGTNLYAAIFSDGAHSTAVITCEGRANAVVLQCNLPSAVMSDLWGNPLAKPVFDGYVATITADVPATQLSEAIKVSEAK